MLKLVSNKDGVEVHTLQIENGVATIEPDFPEVIGIVAPLNGNKQQILNALSEFNPEYVWAVIYESDASFIVPSNDYSLSVVNIVPDAHRDAINQIAELYGCGSNNLSVKLQGEDGIYWGCHSWWKPEDYAQFSDADLRAQIIPAELLPSLEHLYERLVLDGNAQDNWQAALDELNLTLVIEESNV